MLLQISPEQAHRLIEVVESIHEEELIPAESPDCAHSPYKPEYEWLFVYERRLAAVLEKWLRPHRYELIGEKGLLCEALSNAFSHGHKKDPFKPISVKVVLGRKGLIVSIRDSGRGFNVEKVFHAYFSKKAYFYTAGNGLHLMAQSSHFGVFYDAGGRTFHLLHLFDSTGAGLKTYRFQKAKNTVSI